LAPNIGLEELSAISFQLLVHPNPLTRVIDPEVFWLIAKG